MKFKAGDRVRVTKSLLEDYLGLEGLIVNVHPANDYSTFNSYEMRTDDGRILEFLEYQLESAQERP